MLFDDRPDGRKEGFAVLNELLGVFRALAIKIGDQFGMGDLFGGILGHLLQDALGEIDRGFMGHSFTWSRDST